MIGNREMDPLQMGRGPRGEGKEEEGKETVCPSVFPLPTRNVHGKQVLMKKTTKETWKGREFHLSNSPEWSRQ